MTDAINPQHYKHLPAEAIDIILAAIVKAPSNEAACLHWQVLKYVLRCWEKKGIEDLRKAKWYLDRLVGSFDDLLAEINAPILESESEETDQDDHPDRFQVGDTVVSWKGREGIVEAINLIEDFPITVRHSVREQVSYKLGGVKKKGDDHTGVKPQPDPPKPSRTQPPSGYRMLGDAKAEPRIEGDQYWSLGEKGWYPLIEELLRFANDENWAACRKIEEPSEDRIPHEWRKMEIGEDIDQDDKFWYEGRWVSYEKDKPPIPRGKLTDFHVTHIRKIEAPPKRHREPTLADLANGPIECEYRDDDGEQWRSGLLVYMLEGAQPFVCVSKELQVSNDWEQCRIEVQE